MKCRKKQSRHISGGIVLFLGPTNEENKTCDPYDCAHMSITAAEDGLDGVRLMQIMSKVSY